MNEQLIRQATPSPNILKKKSLLVVANWAPEWGRAGSGMWAGWRGAP